MICVEYLCVGPTNDVFLNAISFKCTANSLSPIIWMRKMSLAGVEQVYMITGLIQGQHYYQYHLKM
jgi:hypothetical protein